jgi:hypothetical protein
MVTFGSVSEQDSHELVLMQKQTDVNELYSSKEIVEDL